MPQFLWPEHRRGRGEEEGIEQMGKQTESGWEVEKREDYDRFGRGV